MHENYLIEIVLTDDENYTEKNYFKSLFVDSFGIVKVETTKNPLEARPFSFVNTDRKSSVIKIINNSLKPVSVSVKKLKFNVE